MLQETDLLGRQGTAVKIESAVAHLSQTFSMPMSAIWSRQGDMKGRYMDLHRQSDRDYFMGSMAGIWLAFRLFDCRSGIRNRTPRTAADWVRARPPSSCPSWITPTGPLLSDKSKFLHDRA